MRLEQLASLAEEYVKRSPDNRIAREGALREDLVGEAMYEKPIFAVGDAEDSLFEGLKAAQAVGAHFLAPREWMPEARRVVSLFLPMSAPVREGNRGGDLPGAGWLHARIEGQAMIANLCRHLQEKIIESGGRCVTPLLDERFHAVMDGERNVYTSNWSERHVAFVCGLGTFGLSKGLISRAGVAGRYASLIADLDFPITRRPYTERYEYCRMCGQCARNCPAGAISLEHGKDHRICGEYLAKMQKRFSPRYGCGKCQVGVPCECQPCPKTNYSDGREH